MKERCEARLGRRRGEPIDHYEALLEQSISTAQEYGMLLMELHATYALTRIRADEDHVGDSAGRLAALCDRFTEGFGCPPLQKARELLQTLA
jgi:predicted ATPase